MASPSIQDILIQMGLRAAQVQGLAGQFGVSPQAAGRALGIQEQDIRRREAEALRDSERRFRDLGEAVRPVTDAFRREVTGARAGANLAAMAGLGVGGRLAFGAAGAMAGLALHGAARAEQAVPTAYPGLAIQREYAARDAAAAAGIGLAGTYQASTAAQRAKADFLVSTPGQELLKTWSAVASIPAEIKKAFFEALTPAGQRGRGVGLAPDPRAGHFMSADDLFRAVSGASLQTSPIMVLQDISQTLKRIEGGKGGLNTVIPEKGGVLGFLGNLFP